MSSRLLLRCAFALSLLALSVAVPARTATTTRCPRSVVTHVRLGQPFEFELNFYSLAKGTPANMGWFAFVSLRKPGASAFKRLKIDNGEFSVLPGGWRWKVVYRTLLPVVRGTYRLTIYPVTLFGNGHGGSSKPAPVARFLTVE